MDTPDSLIKDTNVRAVSLVFRDKNYSAKKSRETIVLAKEDYISVLEDVRAWKWIIFNHPMMSQEYHTKLHINNGLLIDDTPYKYACTYSSFRNYIQLLRTQLFIPESDDEFGDVAHDISNANIGLLGLGGSDKMIALKQEYENYIKQTQDLKYKVPLDPNDDKYGKYEWSIITATAIPAGVEVASQITTTYEDDERLFWGKRLKTN